MSWLNKGFIIKVLALLLAVLSFWGLEVKGPDYGSSQSAAVGEQ